MLIAVTVCIVYLPCIHNNFIWDDDVNIYQNSSLWQPDGLLKIWGSFSLYQYYPLTFTSFYLEHLLWGFNPRGYHVTNILLQTSNAILIFFILQYLGLKKLIALFIALLFSIHPIQTETVAWVTERKNLLSGLFYFSSFLLYLKFLVKKNYRFYGFSLFFFVCALLSKTVTVTLPLTLLFAEYLISKSINYKSLLRLSVFFVFGIIMGFITTYLETYRVLTIGEEWNFSAIERAIITARVLLFYATKIIIPLKMSFIYPQWQINPNTFIDWWPIFLLLSVGAGLLWHKEKVSGLLWFSLGHYIVTILPASGIINFYFLRYSFVQNHFQYLAGLGIIIIISTVGSGIINKIIKGPIQSRACILVACIVLFGCGYMTNKQCKIYRDTKTLWSDTISKNPNAWIAHSNLGMILTAEGNLDDGIGSFKKAIAINPNFEEGHNNLGTAYLSKGMVDEAIEALNKALSIESNNAEVHINLGVAYYEKGMIDEAITHYNKALSLKPTIQWAHTNLGLAYLKKGMLDEAINEFKEALVIDPKPEEAHYNLGLTYGKKQLFDEAIAQFKKSIEINPRYAIAHYNLSLGYYFTKEYKKALKHYDQSKKLGLTIKHPFLKELESYR